MRDSLKMLHILIVLELSVFFFQTPLSWVEAALEEQPHSSLVPTRASSWEARPSWSREWSHVAATMSQLALLGLLSPHSVCPHSWSEGVANPTPHEVLCYETFIVELMKGDAKSCPNPRLGSVSSPFICLLQLLCFPPAVRRWRMQIAW